MLWSILLLKDSNLRATYDSELPGRKWVFTMIEAESIIVNEKVITALPVLVI